MAYEIANIVVADSVCKLSFDFARTKVGGKSGGGGASAQVPDDLRTCASNKANGHENTPTLNEAALYIHVFTD